ncbi:MAG TPA: hypothetical protein VD791_02335 [Burkholderiales bacterium]|nr:hypothetical protein [Burkholderiales bacterium]
MGIKLMPFAIALAAVLASGARAEDWDHDANIGAAVQALVAVHRAGGMDAAATFVGDCYATIDGYQDSDVQLQRLEYCAGMDFAGYLVGRQAQVRNGEESPPFFAAGAMFERMQRLDRWVQDPGMNQEVLRAWATTAANSLLAQQQN